MGQLNHHEGRHALARVVFHGQRGELRQRYRQGQEDQLGALGLVVNAIVLWNTIYLDAALAHPPLAVRRPLGQDGFPRPWRPFSRRPRASPQLRPPRPPKCGVREGTVIRFQALMSLETSRARLSRAAPSASARKVSVRKIAARARKPSRTWRRPARNSASG